MKAITLHRYGGPEQLQLSEVPAPQPKADEILIRVKACSVNAGDWHIMRGEPKLVRLFMGLTKPRIRILGGNPSGIVEAVGEKVTRFSVGDEVVADFSFGKFGGYAELVAGPEKWAAHKPKALSWNEAAALPVAATTALQALRKLGEPKPGERVLIQGASGGVGTFAVQLAKHLGANVTATTSTKKMDYVRGLGADQVVDYTAMSLEEMDGPFDLIVAAGGAEHIRTYQSKLTSTGRYVMAGGSNRQMWQAVSQGRFRSKKRGKQLTDFLVKASLPDLEEVLALAADGTIRVPIADTFALADTATAIATLEKGGVMGKVVVRVD